ncbi:heat shock 70 kDa protein 12A-like [Mercenaria mercenaria]|uniref:heat shock 70 kDa protein 12A-like n=1 Tax=Mercenaria mercenaria TaxID=6596 RepID=UPI00234F8DCA|nr:heat shock 70 kDa protein 12A-like [Mercenaria mercenaria]
MDSSAINKKKEKMMVAAIDFGTTFSGYASSFKDEYNKDPTKILVHTWNAGSMSLISLKAPTAVLFDERQQFHSFGYDAENEYKELAADKEHHNWYFFKQFKMRLYEKKKISREMELEDSTHKKMKAKKVFGAVIKYLKDHLLEKLESSGTKVENNDIHWVLTVPAIWPDSAKQFMREAAYEAKIDGGQLSIALEPEAASLYCQTIPTDMIIGSDGAKFQVASPGTKYMVIDLGGGTADITVHEKQVDGGLKEVHKASGGAWGGTKVDEEFKQLLIRIIGAPVYQTFCDENTEDMLDLQRELETKKRSPLSKTARKVTIKVPVKIAETYKKETGEDIKEAIEGCPRYNGKMTWDNDKLRMDVAVYKNLFQGCCDKIINHIKDLMKKPGVKGTNIFLLVGGFSESDLVSNAIKTAFPDVKVISPREAGLAVVKGAVIFGHTPVTITSRVSKYTYGINISPPFDPHIHPDDHRVSVGGIDRCRDIFKKYIHEGETIPVGEARTGKHVTLKSNQREMLLKVFASTKRDPVFVDEEDTECLGNVVVKLPDSTDKIRVEVKMMFGETELKVEAKELLENSTFESYFDFL